MSTNRTVDDERVEQLRRIRATEGEQKATAFAGDAHRAELAEADQRLERSRRRSVDAWKQQDQEERAEEEVRRQELEAQERAERERTEAQERQQAAQEAAERQQRAQEGAGLPGAAEDPSRTQEARGQGEVHEPSAERDDDPRERIFEAAKRAEDRDREREGLGR